MNRQHGIPLDAIQKGRALDEVLSEYMRTWEEANRAVSEPGRDPDLIFADTMTATVYRIYLLGVEDGMN